MAKSADMQIRFWGVRGSIACPGEETLRYGGNTSCVEVRCGDALIIFDGGTGLRPLGNSLPREGGVRAHILFSHTHLDHIVGIPFFSPLFNPKNNFLIHAGHLLPDHTFHEVLQALMTSPLFPVPPEIFRTQVGYHDFQAGESFDLEPGISVKTTALEHPNRATGYRLEYKGHSVCYVTDTEHTAGEMNKNILGLIEGADVLIYDCTYTDAEYPQFEGWGHSTWQEGMKLCEAAGVKTFVIFHHDPNHDDSFMDGVAKEAEAARPGTLVAQEGMIIPVSA